MFATFKNAVPHARRYLWGQKQTVVVSRSIFVNVDRGGNYIPRAYSDVPSQPSNGNGNRTYYDLTDLRPLAANLGLEGAIDLDVAEQLIIEHEGADAFAERKKKRTTEIGVGYGRILLELEKRGYQDIVGLDFSPVVIRTMLEKFGIRATFYLSDIRIAEPRFLGSSYTTFWPWSGLVDLNTPEAQLQGLTTGRQYLAKNGLLSCDIPDTTHGLGKSNITTGTAGAKVSIEPQTPSIDGAIIPTWDGLLSTIKGTYETADMAGLQGKHRTYMTPTDCPRVSFLFWQKPGVTLYLSGTDTVKPSTEPKHTHIPKR